MKLLSTVLLLSATHLSFIGLAYGQSEKPALTPVVIMMNADPEGQMAPFALGVAKGLFAKEGIDLTIKFGKGSGMVSVVLAKDEARFGLIDANTAAKNISEGVPLKMIASYFHASPYALVFFVDKGFRKVSDLKGKKIGNLKTGATNILLPALLKANGMKLGDIENVEVTNENRRQLLVENKIDALGTILMNNKRIEIETGRRVASLEFSKNGLALPGNGIAINTKYLTKPEDRDLNCRFLRAAARAWAEAEVNPKAATEAMMKMFPVTEGGKVDAADYSLGRALDLAKARRQLKKPAGFIFEDDWERLLPVLKDVGVLKETKTVPDYITNEFVDCKK